MVPIPTLPPNEAVEAFCVIEPENIAGPIFVNVDEPETVNEPVIVAAPRFVIFRKVTLPD